MRVASLPGTGAAAALRRTALHRGVNWRSRILEFAVNSRIHSLFGGAGGGERSIVVAGVVVGTSSSGALDALDLFSEP